MASKQTIAELLIEIGLDSREAERAAGRIEKKLDGTKKAAKGLGSETDRAAMSLKRLGKAADSAQRFAGVLTKGLKLAGGTLVGLGAAVLKTGASFEKMRAQLKTVTGSTQAANQAFDFIRDFAKNTPFQVEEITQAFIKMTALGIEPSARALTAFGDFASATGKSLDQFVEAVADAATGEFERLKEFGIKARSEGDRVAFTFRGVTTEVGKNAKEIQEFLTQLSEQNFAGAMSDQMGTLGGMISNLKDSFSEFLLAVAEMGPLEEFKKLIDDLREGAGDKKGLAKVLARTLTQAIRAVRRLIRGDFNKTLETLAKTLQFVITNFDKFIALIAAAKTLQAFNAVAGAFKAMGVAAGGALGPIGAIASALTALIPIAIEAGNKIGNVLAKDRNVARTEQRGGIRTFTEEFGDASGTTLLTAKRAQADLAQAEKTLRDLEENGGGRINKKLARQRVLAAQNSLARAKKDAAEAKKAADQRRNEEARRRREAELLDQKERDAVEREFGAQDQALAKIRKDLGIGDTDADVDALSGRKRDRFEAAALALATNPQDVEAARKAAGLDKPKRRGGGGRRRRQQSDRQITSPTTVSEFFGAAARGELGSIAARTPSTQDIEPTVAVDITNNNFKFDVKQSITGQTSPVEIGREAAAAIKKEFDNRLAAAGQQMATNLAR